MSAARRGEPGLYAADYEHDACGVAFVARLDADAAARDRAAGARGAREPRAPRRRRRRPEHGRRRRHPDADPRRVLPRPSSARRCPPPAATASRCASCPHDADARGRSSRQRLAAIVAEEGQARRLLARRPRRPGSRRPHRCRSRRRVVRQLVVAAGDAVADDQDAFERKLYVIRRRFELEGGADAIVPSFSSRTIVYKGMLTAPAAPRLLPRPAGRAHRDARSLSSTRASRRTRSRAGSSRTRTG